jgi:hypothetical protein
MGGRIDIKPDNVAQLVDEPRVVCKLELMDPVRLETMRAPRAATSRETLCAFY